MFAISDDVLRRIVERLLGSSDIHLTPIPRGGNNRLFVATCPAREPVFVKQYHVDPRDPRDRLRTEYDALHRMRQFGIQQVPTPIAADFDAQVGLYELVAGRPAKEEPATNADVNAALSLAQQLHLMARDPESACFALASEAVLSQDVVVTHIQARVLALRSSVSHHHTEMMGFLEREYLPLLDRLVAECRRRLESAGIAATDLPAHERTLSPCDFGFHNAIRKPGGSLVFVDFEYFGWDDPVKMVSDFVLHPAQALGGALKRTFINGARAHFHTDHTFEARLHAMFPLFGMKWPLILLNAYTDVGAARRRFATVDPALVSANLENDLDMARSALHSMLDDAKSLT